MLCADAATYLNVHKGTKTILLLIDPQNDFHEGGALGISGANEDAKRIAKMIM
jgi:nicotinamidase-related amidase